MSSFKEWEGHIVPKSFSPGYVVLSYVVSYVGAWTTLELINKRTAMRGFYNWFLLAGSSISMGGIAVWCMHFIGNRAIILGDGQIEIQISYNPGFTALSFFVPILVLFLAFWAVGSNETVSIARVTMGGTLAGLGICGMHYLGQAGISNYVCVYTVPHIVGSAIIACFASTGALGMFFLFRSAWNTSWWKRAVSALVLAGAVSGMHWLASVGTDYRLKALGDNIPDNFSRTSTVIVVIVLSIIGCLILLLLTLLAQAQRSRARNRAEQVVLAAAVFDKEGRLMVTSQGLLPSKKITNSYLERSFNDVFGVSHPAFLWIYRTTYNWSSVSRLLPGMRRHMQRAGLMTNRLGSKAEANLLNDQGTPVEDYSIIFRELFCVAADELAGSLNIPLEKLGILYDDIISTGQEGKSKTKGKRSETTLASTVDIERQGFNLPVMGKGQLLFLVSIAGRREVENLQAAGFRFTLVPNVVPIIASSLQVGRHEITRRLAMMREYATGFQVLEPGVHMACFSIRASMASGFDILARKDAKNQLPTMQLPVDTLDSWHLDYLKNMEGMTVGASMKHLYKLSKPSNLSPKSQDFSKVMLTTLEALKDEIDDPFFNDAVLIAKPVEAPCRGPTEDSPPAVAQLITFRIIVPIHSRAPGKKLLFTPLTFFTQQQHVYKNSPDHAAFARKTYREFAPVLKFNDHRASGDVKVPPVRFFPSSMFGSVGYPKRSLNDGGLQVPGETYGNSLSPLPTSQRPSRIRFWEKGDSQPLSKVKSDASSEKNLVDVGGQENQMYGGIMVSQEVSVNVRDADSSSASPHSPRSLREMRGEKGRAGIEMAELEPNSALPKTGVISEATKEEADPKTFVDELFAICIKTKEGAHV